MSPRLYRRVTAEPPIMGNNASRREKRLGGLQAALAYDLTLAHRKAGSMLWKNWKQAFTKNKTETPCLLDGIPANKFDRTEWKW